jgi:hypothetical protein
VRDPSEALQVLVLVAEVSVDYNHLLVFIVELIAVLELTE